MFEVVESDQIPHPIGPYSAALIAENLVFISGQIGMKPDSHGKLPDDICTQTRQALINIESILKSKGMVMSDVAKVNIYLEDIRDFDAVNEIYGEFFSSPFPARCALQVGALPNAAKVEIEAIAIKSSK